MKKLCLSLLAVLLGGITIAHAALSPDFTYQGRLQSGGAAATGLFDLRFELFSVASAGAALGTDLKSGVPVTNGLFTVSLNFGAAPFAGSDRWLQISVSEAGAGSFTTLSPRTPISPTPYALFAPNAGTVPWGGITGLPASFGDGVDNDTTYAAGPGLTLGGGNVFSVNFAGNGAADTASHSDHTHYGQAWSGAAAKGLTLETSAAGAGDAALYARQGGPTANGLPTRASAIWGDSRDGYGVVGYSLTSFGVFGASRDDIGVRGNSMNGQAIYGLGEGNDAVGVYGIHRSSNGTNAGVYGITASDDHGASGVYGYASRNSGKTYGVVGASASTNGFGVCGLASATTGTNFGVFGESKSRRGVGVRGEGIRAGVEGWGAEDPVLLEDGIGVWGSGDPGLYGVGRPPGANGVFGIGDTGVRGRGFDGVIGQSDSGGSGSGVTAIGSGTNGTALRISSGAIRVSNAGVNTQTPVFIHRSTAASTTLNRTIIDNPFCNNKPSAILMVTHNFGADTSANQFETHAYGVWYDPGINRWTIYHEDNSVMPDGRAYNVMVFHP